MADWMTLRDACELSGFNADHLRDLLRKGKIRAQKFGTLWQVDRESLLAYLREANKSPDKRRGPKT